MTDTLRRIVARLHRTKTSDQIFAGLERIRDRLERRKVWDYHHAGIFSFEIDREKSRWYKKGQR